VSGRLNLTYGLRVDFPMYFTNPVDNPFSRGLTALDANGNPEIVDQSKLPNATALWSPRVGFIGMPRVTGAPRCVVALASSRAVYRSCGSGTCSRTWRQPEPVPSGAAAADRVPDDSSTLAQSFDVNAVNPKFKWPQVWTSDLAIDHQLPGGLLGTLESSTRGHPFHRHAQR